MKEHYEIEYSDRFLEDIQVHKKAGQKSVLEKINLLIDELREHPYTGTGCPEPLKYNKKGQWSRRITKKHRLVYIVEEQKVTVLLLAALGHYDNK
ncbi:MAG: Txe/YoeB family addiction module toxin [Mangrovibacterium sp.]|nr:Txe/YoeB family addiction module toxin [Mangrovibacterium sp.]